MNLYYRVKGNWTVAQQRILANNNLKPEHPFVILSDEESNTPIWNEIMSSIVEKTAVSAVFSSSELENADSFVIKRSFPNLAFPFEDTNGGDGDGYLRYAFGEVCNELRIPKKEQENYLVLQSEPKDLPSGYLFGSVHWSPGYLITDIKRANFLEASLNLKSLPLLIGMKRKVSKNFVQLVLPIANSKLNFRGSNFEVANICKTCEMVSHSVKQLDFFPEFIDDVDSDLCYTKEWFGSYRQLVVKRTTLEFLLSESNLKYDSDHLIPVRTCSKIV